jgi:hypothetical protein
MCTDSTPNEAMWEWMRRKLQWGRFPPSTSDLAASSLSTGRYTNQPCCYCIRNVSNCRAQRPSGTFCRRRHTHSSRSAGRMSLASVQTPLSCPEVFPRLAREMQPIPVIIFHIAVIRIAIGWEFNCQIFAYTNCLCHVTSINLKR